jgi:N-acetyl-anhydromuramyl-L-alanine amidase AmpD/V8-like Glu-specific endopeptidase
MTTQIRPNRLEVSDRFPMLGFTVRTDGSAKRYEIAIGTSPDLFGPDGKSHRSRSNFYSTRAAGPLPIERGESVYVLPAEVLARFVGQEKLYYGLATASNGAAGVEVNTMPGLASPYINISRLTGRSLQRVRLLPNRQRAASNYGKAGSEMDWAGDAMTPGTQPATPPAAKNGAAKDGSSATVSVHYDDGYGPLPASPPPAVPKPQPQAKSLGDDVARADEDAQHGIEGPIPDEGSAAQALASPMAIAAEYPQASRFEPAASTNYRAVTGMRTINRIVIHITDGQPKLNGTVSWFQNPSAGVSAHYVVGQDGEVVQMVKHNDIAWHASSANGDSIGIEHVARSPHEWDKKLGRLDPGMMPTEQQYCSSAALVNWLCNHFNLPTDRTHVLGHSEADPRTTHTDCPNGVWDWDYYMGLVTSGTCTPDTAAASSLVQSASVPRTPGNGSSMPRAKSLKQVDPAYAPSNPQDALQYMKQFQDRKQAWKAGVPNTTFFPHSAICRLRIFQPDGEYIGTGFYIDSDRILTCAHNVAHATDVTIIPGKNDTAEPFGAFPARTADWVIHPKYNDATADSLPTGHDFDLAVIKVTIPPPNGQAFAILEELLQCQESPIIVCGYAADTVNRDKQHLDGDEIRLLSDSGESFLYNLQTEPGNSGSPVYYVTARDDEQQQACVLETRVVGVHIASVVGSNIFNQGCRLTADKIAWIKSVGKPFSAGAAESLSLSHGKHHKKSAAAQATADDGVDGHGIEGPIPDEGAAAQSLARSLALSPEYPQASRFELADSGNYHAISGTRTINRIVIHITDGGSKINGTVGWFKNPAAKVSAHYIVGQDGEVVQMVKHNDVAWHASSANGDSIGIEHVANTKGLNPTPMQYSASAALANWLASQFNIPVDRTHILGHSEADPKTSHKACPNAVWDWDYYMGMVTSATSNDPQTQSLSLSVGLPVPPKKRRTVPAAALGPVRMVRNSPLNTVTGGEGNVTWELDQFPGVKTAAQSAVAPLQSAETIELTNWPYCDHANGTRANAWFTVDWKFSGQSLGQVRITPAGSQQGSEPLRVEARIEDGTNRDATTTSLTVRFTYHFSTADGLDVVALTELKLYSDGSIDQSSNWTSPVAA